MVGPLSESPYCNNQLRNGCLKGAGSVGTDAMPPTKGESTNACPASKPPAQYCISTKKSGAQKQGTGEAATLATQEVVPRNP